MNKKDLIKTALELTETLKKKKKFPEHPSKENNYQTHIDKPIHWKALKEVAERKKLRDAEVECPHCSGKGRMAMSMGYGGGMGTCRNCGGKGKGTEFHYTDTEGNMKKAEANEGDGQANPYPYLYDGKDDTCARCGANLNCPHCGEYHGGGDHHLDHASNDANQIDATEMEVYENHPELQEWDDPWKPKKKSEINKKHRLQSTIDIGNLTPEELEERSKKRRKYTGRPKPLGEKEDMAKIREISESDLDKKLAELQSKKIDKNLKDTKRKLGKIGRRLVTPPDIYPSEIKTVEFMTGLADARHAELEAKKKRKKKKILKAIRRRAFRMNYGKPLTPEGVDAIRGTGAKGTASNRGRFGKQSKRRTLNTGEINSNISDRAYAKILAGEKFSESKKQPRTVSDENTQYFSINGKLLGTGAKGKKLQEKELNKSWGSWLVKRQGEKIGEEKRVPKYSGRTGEKLVTGNNPNYTQDDTEYVYHNIRDHKKMPKYSGRTGEKLVTGNNPNYEPWMPREPMHHPDEFTHTSRRVDRGDKKMPKYSGRTGEKLVTGNQGSISKLKAIRDDALRLKYEAGAGQNGTSPRGGFYGTNENAGWNVRHNETIEKKPKKKV